MPSSRLTNWYEIRMSSRPARGPIRVFYFKARIGALFSLRGISLRNLLNKSVSDLLRSILGIVRSINRFI